MLIYNLKKISYLYVSVTLFVMLSICGSFIKAEGLCESYLEGLTGLKKMNSKQRALSLDQIKALGAKPYLGVILKLENAGLVLAVGPYFRNSHAALTKALIDSDYIFVEGVLWAGELLITTHKKQITIHGANETSGFLNAIFENRSALRNFFNPTDLPIELQHAFIMKSNVNWLDFFKSTKGVSFSDKYVPHKFDIEQQHLLPELNFGDLNERHDFGNNITTMLSWLDLKIVNPNSNLIDLEIVKSNLDKLIKFSILFLEFHHFSQSEQIIKQDIIRFIEIAEGYLVDPNLFKSQTTDKWVELRDLVFSTYSAIFMTKSAPLLFQVKVKDQAVD